MRATTDGKITDVMQPGGNDVYVISGKRGEVLVPALRSVVISVDTKAGEMPLECRWRTREAAALEDQETDHLSGSDRAESLHLEHTLAARWTRDLWIFRRWTYDRIPR